MQRLQGARPTAWKTERTKLAAARSPCSAARSGWPLALGMLLGLVAVLCLAANAQTVLDGDHPGYRPRPMTWAPSFGSAVATAKQRAKPLVLEFYTNACPYSRKMKESVYPQPAVAAFSANQVWVRLDQERGEGQRLVKQFNGGATPTYMAVAHDGKTVYYRFSDAVSAQGLIHNLSLIDIPSAPPQSTLMLRMLENGKARSQTPAERWTKAKTSLMEGRMEPARAMLKAIIDKDAANASGLADDALVLLGSVENATWNDEGARQAKALWTRVLVQYPSSDRAPDAVFYLACLLQDVGPKDRGAKLLALLKEYPSGVDVAAAKRIVTAP